MRNATARTDREVRVRRGILTKTLAVATLAVVALAAVACSAGDAEDELGSIASAVAPDTLCTSATFNGHTYWFCNNLRNWSSARSKCEAEGLNLARVDTSAENDFIRAQVIGKFWLRAWIGANDTATEGVWRWTFGASQFWNGNWNGSATPGMFSRWGILQPDNFINQDCAKLAADGTWLDEGCGSIDRYICESGADLCPADPQKVEFGVCGCGVPDVDSDGDGKLDCEEQCPNDPTKLVPGHCGCSDAPKPAGTICRDGLCDANVACDGAGVCGNPGDCAPPDSECRFRVVRNTYYWFCDNDRPFADARQRCQSAGMDLAVVEDAFEDGFITANTHEHTFIGATDQAVEGNWIWLGAPLPFWTGGQQGSAVAGGYTNWEFGQPSDGLFGKDCLVKDPPIGHGFWETRSCNDSEAFACERESLPPLPNPLDLKPNPHLDPAAQGRSPVGPGAITPNPDATPGQDACGVGLDLVTIETEEMEIAPRLVYPLPPLNTTPGDPDCRVAYQECTDDNQSPRPPSESELNQAPPVTQICEAIPDRVIEECGIDTSTIDLSAQGLCTSHFQCVGRGAVCALVCSDASCSVQERRCAAPNPGCFGLFEQENCATARECAEPDYTGEADPFAQQNDMAAHPPGNIEQKDTAPAEITNPPKNTLGPYAAVTDANVCRLGTGPAVSLQTQSEVRDINVGNEKWGLYVKPKVVWGGIARPLPLLGESTLSTSGEVGFTVGAYVWKQDVKLLNVEATAELREGCTLTFDRTVEVIGISVDPGNGNTDFTDFVAPGCQAALAARASKAGSLKHAEYNAVAVKEYVAQFGPTIQLCTKFKQAFPNFVVDCNTAAGRQTVVDYWFNEYQRLQAELLQNQATIETSRQALVNKLPATRLPVFDDQRHFTFFDHSFTYPVGPATVTIDIEVGGSWGASGGLEMRWTPNPTRISAAGTIHPNAEATAFAFAGIGIGPVSFGIAGELLLIGAQAPLLAEVAFEEVESADTRPHRYFQELGLPPSTAFPPTKYEWASTWAYGARPELQLLAGQIDLAARVDLFFFTKTFRKKIADWDGIKHVFDFVANSGDALQGNPDFGVYGEDFPFVDPASLRPIPPATFDLNATEEPAWILACFDPPA